MLRARFFTDAVSAGLIVLSMAYFWTGTALHEWCGLLAVLTLLAHNVVNRRWWAKPFAGTPSAQKIATFALNLALALSVAAVAASGAMLSEEIFPFVPAGEGLTARTLHTTGAVWLFVLSALHAGMHTPFLAGALKNLFGKKSVPAKKDAPKGSKLALGIRVVVAAALCVCGISAFARRAVGEKLFAQASFDPYSFDDALPRFLLDYFYIAALFFIAGALLQKFLRR